METGKQRIMADTIASAFGTITNPADADLIPIIVGGANRVVTAANLGVYMAAETGLDAHLADTVDAHDASAISNVAAGNIVATTVQAAIDELDSEKLSKVAGGAAVENIGAIESDVNTVATSGSTETLDISVKAIHDVTMDQNCTFTFSNPAPSGKCSMFTLILRGAFTPTWPASVDWPDATQPTYTSPSIYTFMTVDGGTIWLGAQAGKAFG